MPLRKIFKITAKFIYKLASNVIMKGHAKYVEPKFECNKLPTHVYYPVQND